MTDRVISGAAKAIRRAALRDAADHLTRRADDFRELARQVRKQMPAPGEPYRDASLLRAEHLESMASILAEQARKVESL